VVVAAVATHQACPGDVRRRAPEAVPFAVVISRCSGRRCCATADVVFESAVGQSLPSRYSWIVWSAPRLSPDGSLPSISVQPEVHLPFPPPYLHMTKRKVNLLPLLSPHRLSHLEGRAPRRRWLTSMARAWRKPPARTYWSSVGGKATAARLDGTTMSSRSAVAPVDRDQILTSVSLVPARQTSSRSPADRARPRGCGERLPNRRQELRHLLRRQDTSARRPRHHVLSSGDAVVLAIGGYRRR